ncbi:MAG: GNAT family N-acetyltransferase [Jatrophihabitans sp.]
MQPEWVGRRVVVRRVLGVTADPAQSARVDKSGQRFGDVLGDLLRLDADRAVIATNAGPVEVAVADITLARLVQASTAAQLNLERIAAAGWQPAETEWIGGWLLRGSTGWTGRANSALPLKSPGMPMDEMLQRVHRWYAERNLPPRIHVSLPARQLLDAFLADTAFRKLEDEADVGVWQCGPVTDVLVSRLDLLPSARIDGAAIEVAEVPSADWLGTFREGSAPVGAVDILTRHDRVAFLTVRDSDGAVLAIVRGVVDDGWLGITGLEVPPERRGQGHSRTAMAAIVDWARREHGAQRSYLQVEEHNEPARQLYGSLGYHLHHTYRYWDRTR